MTFVTHHGSRGNQSRPRDLLNRRSIQRLRDTAERMGFDVKQRATKEEIIEMITTDKPIPAEVEEAPEGDTADAEVGGEAE